MRLPRFSFSGGGHAIRDILCTFASITNRKAMTKKASTSKQRPSGSGWMSSLKAFFTHERTRFITGLILSFLTIYVGLSLISFFFTGAADQSKIENIPVSDLVANRGTVDNWTDVRGAYLSDRLMNR